MRDYREYKTLYKLVGFFLIIVVTFMAAYKVSNWLIWAHQCINAAL